MNIVEESDLRRLWTGKEGNGKEGKGAMRIYAIAVFG